MTRLWTGLLIMGAVISSLTLMPDAAAAQKNKFCWKCVYNWLGTKEWCQGETYKEGAVLYKNCNDDKLGTYCSTVPYARCLGPPAGFASVAPDGAVLVDDGTRNDSPSLDLGVANTSNSAGVLGLGSAASMASAVPLSARPPALRSKQESAAAAEVMVAPGHWRVLRCDDVVLGRRYSKSVATGLKMASTVISL